MKTARTLFHLLCLVGLFFNFSLAVATSVHAQENQNSTLSTNPPNKTDLTIGVREVAPFVIKTDDGYEGFSIDLIKKIAEKSGVTIKEFKVYSNVGDLVNAVEKKEVDAGIAAISITDQRIKQVTFSYPMMYSGLKVMVPTLNSQENDNSIFTKMWRALSSKEFGLLVAFTLLIALIPAHIMYFIEGLREKGMFSKNYFKGITQAFGWTLNTIAIGPSEHPNTNIGKIVSLIWIYLGIIFVAFFTASITTDLTSERLQGSIGSISDLPGKNVVTIKNSTAERYLNKAKIDHTSLDNVNTAMEDVAQGKYEAMVFDAPMLDYYTSTLGKNRTRVVGDLFKGEEYGIAEPKDFEHEDAFDTALLQMKDNGEYADIYQKWFGKKP